MVPLRCCGYCYTELLLCTKQLGQPGYRGAALGGDGDSRVASTAINSMQAHLT
jgi:hypothetical protein